MPVRARPVTRIGWPARLDPVAIFFLAFSTALVVSLPDPGQFSIAIYLAFAGSLLGAAVARAQGRSREEMRTLMEDAAFVMGALGVLVWLAALILEWL